MAVQVLYNVHSVSLCVCVCVCVCSLQLCRTMARHHQELEQQQKRTVKDEVIQLKKIASLIAKEVKHFWDSIQKVNVYTVCALFLCGIPFTIFVMAQRT